MPKLRYSEFKHRIDVDAVESALGFDVLTHDRGNDIGYCLFPENHQHGDTTGKMAIHRDMLVYNCWVCSGGSLLSLVMEKLDLDVDDATVWLYQFTQGDNSRNDIEFRDYLIDMLADVEERTESMPYFNERVLDKYGTSEGYFAERGIIPAVVHEYKLRFHSQVHKSAPIKHQGDQAVKIDDDYIGPSAIFPHYWQGRLVGWQNRWLHWDEAHTHTPRWLPKYTNTADFPKHNTLFNYDHALNAACDGQRIVVLESVPSALFLISNNYPAVSYFGGDQLKPQQLRLLRRFQAGVILAPDNDKTGERFVRSATQYLERFIPVYVAEPVQLGIKADLGDYAKTQEPVTNLKNHMNNRVHHSGVEI